jgi:hypothetical protein
MAIVADRCPRCRRLTRCAVVEGTGGVGGVLFGIPFWLPTSTAQTSCGECGHSFRSTYWPYPNTVVLEIAVLLPMEELLDRTNPALKEVLTLEEIRADHRLEPAFQLLGLLWHGTLRTRLIDGLKAWRKLDEAQQERFLKKVNDCREALQFARRMARQIPSSPAGCLAGVLACVGVSAAFRLALAESPQMWGWLGVVAAGLVAGGVTASLLQNTACGRWVRTTFLPEARKHAIDLRWVLAVLEDRPPSDRVSDELRLLRDQAERIRTDLRLGEKVVSDGGVQQSNNPFGTS